MKKVYFENLDGLRFIAFVGIFLTHGIFTFDKTVESSTFFHVLKTVIRPSEFGVPFFFCLSGFLITYLLLTEIKKNERINIGNFYMRRILRIWPLYLAVVVFGFFIFPYLRSFFIHEPYTEVASLWKYLCFMSNYDQMAVGRPFGAGLGVTWSLSVEEQFYLAWPLLLTIVPRKYFIQLCLFLFVLGYVLIDFFELNYIHIMGSMVDLSIGACIAVISFDKNKVYNFLSTLNKATITLIYILGFTHLYTYTLLGFGHRIFISFFMVFVIFEQCFAENSVFKMGKLQRISYLGTLTYGFYLLHTISNFIIYNILKLFRNKIDMPIFSDLVLQPILCFALTIAAGYLSYKYFEKPFLNLKSKFAQ